MVAAPPGLGPHCVGLRVVVRRVLRGIAGPTGGPAMTDVLGVMESWDATATTVRDDAGALTSIRLADIVSGKPVPPRPSPRLRVSPEDAEHLAVSTWPALVSAPLGCWLLRAASGYSARANSVLAAGDPGTSYEDALSAVREFYAAHGLPALAQVVVGSTEHRRLEEAGWGLARPEEDDTVFQLAPVAQASRAVRRLAPDAPEVDVRTTPWPGWLADEARTLRHGADALAVLEGPKQVAFVGLGDPVVAKGRVALTDASDPWAGISNVWVHPEHRRQGLSLVVLAEMLAWAAERGARTAFLQVRGDNPGALALYHRLGFVEHHRYRYLLAP